jgi:hypothetical protein
MTTKTSDYDFQRIDNTVVCPYCGSANEQLVYAYSGTYPCAACKNEFYLTCPACNSGEGIHSNCWHCLS